MPHFAATILKFALFVTMLRHLKWPGGLFEPVGELVGLRWRQVQPTSFGTKLEDFFQ